ncbi:MAG: cyclic nucleotide-binding domain-containing protein [Deltaproteobacteria bacterium]|nr:cyclic nucleotide-binding domain-containing protein [Deltaproteobacteria bacterium]
MSDKVRKLKDTAARHLAKGRSEQALSALLEVVDLEPRDLQSRQRCGDLYRKLGKNQLAIEAYQAVAGAYAADGLLLKAIAICKVILQIDADHTETQRTLADLYARKRGNVLHAELPPTMASALVQAPRKAAAASIRGRPVTEMAIPIARVEAIELPAAAEVEPPAPAEEVEEIAIVEEEEAAGAEEELVVAPELVEAPLAPRRIDLEELPPIPLFSDLPKRAFVDLLERMALHCFQADEVLLREGDVGDSFYIVASGKVRVVRERGKSRTIELAVLGEGSFFGEMALLGDGVRAATVITAEPAELLEISRSMLDGLIKSHPSVQQVMMRFYRQRLLSNLLKTSPIFQPFSQEVRKQLIEKFKQRELPRGTRIVAEGEPGDGLYVLLTGRCEVSRRSDGRRVVLAELREGDLFGEMSLLSQHPVSATVTAVRKSIVLRLPKKVFGELIMTHPQILELVSTLSEIRAQSNAEILGEPVSSDDEVRV